MTNSLRWKLTLWYAAVLGATIGTASIFVYGQLARNHYEQLETRLETGVRVIGSSLDHEIEEHGGKLPGEESFRFVLKTIHPLTFPDLELAILENNRLVGSKPETPDRMVQERIFQEATRRSEGAGGRGAVVVWSSGGWRWMALRTQMRGSEYLVVAGGSEKRADAEVRALQEAFLLGLPVPLLLAGAGGWWLVRKSLKPIATMSETTDAISAQSLEKRLEIENPDDELGRLGRTFNRLLDRLESSFEQQRRFMSDASHELRTPVSIAQTAAQVTLESENRSSAEYREALGIISGQMRRMARLVEDMFLLAKVDAGALKVRRENCYLEEILEESMKAARVLAAKKQIRVSGGPWPEAPYVGDETRLRQAVMILLDNAIKYAPENSEVQLDLQRMEGRIRIVVHDEGGGIPEEEKEKIFERFYRRDKARTRTGEDAGGAGLGLPIARWIAEAHLGTLTLFHSSAPGTTFHLELKA